METPFILYNKLVNIKWQRVHKYLQTKTNYSKMQLTRFSADIHQQKRTTAKKAPVNSFLTYKLQKYPKHYHSHTILWLNQSRMLPVTWTCSANPWHLRRNSRDHPNRGAPPTPDDVTAHSVTSYTAT